MGNNRGESGPALGLLKSLNLPVGEPGRPPLTLIPHEDLEAVTAHSAPRFEGVFETASDRHVRP